jgi:virginiamycin B lyase
MSLARRMSSWFLALTWVLVACGRTDLLPASPAAEAGRAGGASHGGSEETFTGGRFGTGGLPGTGGVRGTGGAIAPAGTGGAILPLIVEFPIPTEGADPRRITTGPDGNLWFTECRPDQLGRLSPTGEFAEFTMHFVDTRHRCPQGIAAVAEDLWYTVSLTGWIGVATTAGNVNEHGGLSRSVIQAIAANSSGVWLAGDSGYVAMSSFTGNQIDRSTDPQIDWQELALGPDDTVWVTAPSSNLLGRCKLTEACTLFELAQGSYPFGITAGPDGHMWFAEAAGNRIGRTTLDGTITEFSLPTQDSSPRIITAGSDGALWFTEYLVNKIGRITMDGQVSEFDVPTPASYPLGITSGPDGNIWFTEQLGNKIGRVEVRR